MSLTLAKIAILKKLRCPARDRYTALVITGYFDGRPGGRLGLEQLADLMGHEGQWKFGQRAVRSVVAWQKQVNVQLFDHIPGERNVRKVTEFHNIQINAAAFWISQRTPNDEAPTQAKLEALVPEAINRFLRRPLAIAPQQQSKEPPKQKQARRFKVADGPVSQYTLLANSLIDRFYTLPVNPATKKPALKNWIQNATKNPERNAEWGRKWPDVAVGILTGRAQPGKMVLLLFWTWTSTAQPLEMAFRR